MNEELPDDDPEVLEGMKRLAELREHEADVIDFPPVESRQESP